jgi:hypothetical protein
MPLYRRKAGVWKQINIPPAGGGGGGGSSVTQATRDAQVFGTYKPNSRQLTGSFPGTTFNHVYPPTGSQTIQLTGTSYSNTTFWGLVRSSNAATFRNCRFVGADPASTQFNVLSGNVSNLGPTGGIPQVLTFFDCSFDSSDWIGDTPGRPLAATATRRINPNGNGIHGGNVELYRCEITNVQDGINYTTGQGTHAVLESCWIHRMYYQDNWYGPSDGRSHSDVFQFNHCKDLLIQNSVLGGNRVPEGYPAITDPAWGTGSNLGDDAWNSCLMIKEEGTWVAANAIDGVLIQNNWFYGGQYAWNMFYQSDHPNTFAGMSLINNKFGQRPASWGGGYIIKSPEITATITGNTIEETGAPVPISTGGSS